MSEQRLFVMQLTRITMMEPAAAALSVISVPKSLAVSCIHAWFCSHPEKVRL